MDAPREYSSDDITRLGTGLNDLGSILALPAVWAGAEPSQIVSTLVGLLMVLAGTVWVLQGLDIAFQANSFMAGDPQWAVWGSLLAVAGLGQAIWSVTRKR